MTGGPIDRFGNGSGDEPRGDGERAIRGADGRFLPGCPGGPGSPVARRTAELRAALLDAVSIDDLRGIIAKLIEQARGGDVLAAREVLDRLFGKARQGVDVAAEQDHVVQYQLVQVEFDRLG